MEANEGFTLRIGAQEFEATPDNISLFTFLGTVVVRGMDVPAANLNHIFCVQQEVEANRYSGFYIWNTNPGFAALGHFLLEHDYPAHLNQRKVGQCDIDAWEAHTFGDLTDEGLNELLNGEEDRGGESTK